MPKNYLLTFFICFFICFFSSKINAQIQLTDSNLPIVVIETFGQINEFQRITAEMGIINNADGERNYITDEYNEYDGQIAIKYRGSSSLGFDKKNYSVETQTETGENNNVPLFGFAEEND